jgi:probable phosphoglycerate mutase
MRQNEPVRLYLVRHGQTVFNALGRTQGWSDSPLTDVGRETAARVGANLRAHGEAPSFDAAYAADMVRHGETAALLLEAMSDTVPLTRTAALRETGFGGYEGMKTTALWRRMNAHLRERGDARKVFELPLRERIDLFRDSNPSPEHAAEGYAEASTRLLAAANRIGADHADARRVLAVSSGMSIIVLLDALGIAEPPRFLENGSVTILEHADGTWTAVEVGTTRFAEGRFAAGGLADGA